MLLQPPALPAPPRAGFAAALRDRPGARFGAFLEGELRASLGLVEVEAGLARYQNVETQAGWRRRGLASCLLAHAASWARSTWGTRTLVLAADPKGPAIHLYRALGFRARETQLELLRPPPT
ncbi:MAG: GNAT family N-acetyltransferase [Candidatus Dormibacteria bacterium]